MVIIIVIITDTITLILAPEHPVPGLRALLLLLARHLDGGAHPADLRPVKRLHRVLRVTRILNSQHFRN